MKRTIMTSQKILKMTSLGILVGLLVGLLGSIFLIAVISLGNAQNKILQALSDHIIWQLLFSISFCLVTILLSVWLVKRFEPHAAGSGVQEIEGVLAGERPLTWYKVIPVKFFGGLLAMTSGLVVGREGPMIHMGGSIGAMLKPIFNLSDENRHILIASGAAAGLAVAFNAPLAGIVFIIEEMRYQFKYSFKSVQTVIAACVVADIVLRSIMGMAGYNVRLLADIPMSVFDMPPLSSLWLFVICGMLFGVIGVYFTKGMIVFSNFFARLSKCTFWLTIAMVALTWGVLTVFYSYIIGGGYNIIPDTLGMKIGIYVLILVFVLRLLTTWISYGTGAVGGFFAPMLALGTVFGSIFGHYAHILFPSLIPEGHVFAVAGMAALFTAAVGAPLTGIVLVIEMTMNYNLILPLILTCLSATLTAMFFGQRPIYATLLKRTIVLEHKKSLYLKRFKK